MKKYIALLLSSAFTLTSVTAIVAQQQDLKEAQRPEASTAVRPEEKIIRETYKKLSKLSRAATRIDRDESLSVDSKLDDAAFVQFELSNFKFGNIDEITKLRRADLITPSTDDVLSFRPYISTKNHGPEHIAYKTNWVKSEFGTLNDKKFTVAEILRLFPKQSYDIGEYVAYDVKVSYLGKSRTYRALALFHNLYASSQNLQPEFWDSVTGTGGILMDVRSERRPLIGDKEKIAAPSINRLRPNGNDSTAFKIVAANWNRLGPQPLPVRKMRVPAVQPVAQ
jgi:hypothetical protein